MMPHHNLSEALLTLSNIRAETEGEKRKLKECLQSLAGYADNNYRPISMEEEKRAFEEEVLEKLRKLAGK